uniref:Late embryogenesis abundant protein LEA-2 subgroup domain-containing protein n=2 Tax=Setaria TaxID=4554 RepID=K3YE68_SETIT
MPADGEEYSFCALCGTCVVQILLLSMMILLLAYALLYPVKVTVSDASLSRFALNGTALSYDLSLAVSLLFAGRRFYGARLVGTGHSVKLEKSGELRLRAVGQAENAAEVLGSDGVAELVKETVAGEIQSLELKLS